MSRNIVNGIIFDLDGTLIRSSIDFIGMKRKMIATLENHGVPSGLLSPNETTVAAMEKAERVWREKGMSTTERERILAEIEEIMNKIELEAMPTVKEVKGAVKAISLLRERGYRLAVLTRGHKAYAVKALEKTGMLRYFDLVLGREDTPRPKPYAEALQHTAELMGISLDDILLVGDHPIDSTCAENACVSFIAVLTGPTKEIAWIKLGQDTILNSVKDLPAYLAEAQSSP